MGRSSIDSDLGFSHFHLPFLLCIVHFALNQVLPKLPIHRYEFSHDRTSNPYRVTTSTLGPPVASLRFGAG